MEGVGIMNLEFYCGKKVFITGHTGFKGTWLSKILINAGAEVTGYSLTPNTKPSIFELLNIENQMNSIIGDVRNLEKLKQEMVSAKPEIVFHLAAQPLVRESYSNPVHTYETNVMGTVNVLEAIRACSSIKSFVNVTTDKVYENKEWHWGYRENENLCGLDPYSNSKSCSELVTYSYKNSFLNNADSPSISTARSGNVIGGGDYSKDRIIPDCIKAASEDEAIIVRNPFSTRPYQHVLDCLSGYLLLAQKQFEDKVQFEGCYNFGPDDQDCITTGKLVDLFCKSWGNEQKWIDKWDNGPHEANFLKLDCSKSKTILNWKPTWSVEIAIEKTVEWSKVALNDQSKLNGCTNQQIDDFFNKKL